MCFQGNKHWSLRTLKWSSIVTKCPHLFDRNTGFLLHLRDICTSSETPQEPYRNKRLVKHILEFGSICWINYNLRYIMCSLQYVVCISNIPLFWWCWGLLARYYFRCLILHWIEYIQRNKDFNGNHRNGPMFVRISVVCDLSFGVFAAVWWMFPRRCCWWYLSSLFWTLIRKLQQVIRRKIVFYFNP